MATTSAVFATVVQAGCRVAFDVTTARSRSRILSYVRAEVGPLLLDCVTLTSSDGEYDVPVGRASS